jgi:hypothetical protein
MIEQDRKKTVLENAQPNLNTNFVPLLIYKINLTSPSWAIIRTFLTLLPPLLETQVS